MKVFSKKLALSTLRPQPTPRWMVICDGLAVSQCNELGFIIDGQWTTDSKKFNLWKCRDYYGGQVEEWMLTLIGLSEIRVEALGFIVNEACFDE